MDAEYVRTGTTNGTWSEPIPPADAEARALSYEELLTLDVPPARPLVAGLVHEETGTIVGGPPNVGKSWLVLEVARCVAGSVPFLGHFATVQADVLIVDEESHLAGLQSRVRMLEAVAPLGPRLPLSFAVGKGLRVDAGVGVAHLDALLTRHRPGLVIADSLTRVHGGDENSAGQMADVFYNVKQLMRAHKCAFLFTDHVRKRGLINDVEEMLRGSTEKRAWPDSILAVEPSDQGRDLLTVSHTKARHGPRLDPFAVRLEIGGLPMDPMGSVHGARLAYGGEVRPDQRSRANDIVAAIHSLKAQQGEDAADATAVAAWMDCSADTVRRHVARLVGANILAVRKAAASSKGGPRRDVYDVVGGNDR